jgi:hypothetical protein
MKIKDSTQRRKDAKPHGKNNSNSLRLRAFAPLRLKNDL